MQRILIIGLGLIGGSFARALRKHQLAKEIFVFDSDLEAIELAKKEKIVEGFSMIEDGFDLIVIATPLSSYAEIIAEISKLDLKNTVILDLGSLKEFVLKSLNGKLKEKFVAAHPIAGSDKSGFANSSADLFTDKKFIICNENSATKTAVELIAKIGGKVEFIEAKKHDEIYALVSHLPQFLSFLTREFSPKTAHPAFRLDNSPPEIWEDIFKLNEKNLEKFYLEFFDNLQGFSEMLREGDFESITQKLNSLLREMDSCFRRNDAKRDLNNIGKDWNDAEQEAAGLDKHWLFRLIIVASYLKIAKIKELQSFAGSGFRDFTSIISLAENKNLTQNLQKNSKEILKLIEKLS